LHYGSDLPPQASEEEKPNSVPLKTRKCSAWRILFMLAAIIGGIGCIEIPVFLQHREERDGKLLVFSVPALAAVFLECAHHENVDKVQRLFGHLIERVAFDEKHIFVSEVHKSNEMVTLVFEKAADTLISGWL